MDGSASLSKAPSQDRRTATAPQRGRPYSTIYGVCTAVSIATWLLAIGAPLWVDETGSYWLIEKGFGQIAARVGFYGFPAYYYILWLGTRVLGTSEIALRIPSVLAMLGAAWLVYLAAREMFDRERAAIAVVVFCLEPVVVFASVDAGVYAFATLMTAAAIVLLLRLGKTDGSWPAVLLGLATAGVMWFHYLFAVIGPALVVCFFVVKRGSGRAMWRQLGAAACGFAAGMAPVVPGIAKMFRTRGTHVYLGAPVWRDLLVMVTPGVGALLLFAAAGAALAATAARRRRAGNHWNWAGWDGVICAALAGIPMGILYGVSALTPVHVSAPPWHLLASAPGIALGWAWMARGLESRRVQVALCVLVTAAGVYRAMTAPMSVSAQPSDKYAVAAAEKNASVDGAPVVVCSDFVESDYEPMPVGGAKESRLFSQLAYYRLSVPVVPLPKALNAEAMRVGGEFVDEATTRQERFLAMGDEPSYPTLDWLAKRAAEAYSVRVLGVFSDVKVMEFTPRGKSGGM